MSKETELINAFKETDAVLKLKKYEALVKEDSKLNSLVKELHYVSKQATNAKEFGLINAYNDYLKLYQDILKQFDDNVILSMYLDNKASVEELLNLITSVIESRLNKELNGKTF